MRQVYQRLQEFEARREHALEEKLITKQLYYENTTRSIASNYQKAETIRNGERALKQGKYFNQ
jgi:hypothetical protein